MGILRLLLAASVVASHMGIHGLPFVSPYLSVLLFYVASGFYMSMVINDKYARLPKWVGTFYLSRFLRLAPVYYVSLLLAFTMLVATGRLVPAATTGWVLATVSNLSLIGLDYGFLANSFKMDDWRVISIAWTLAIEAQFYFLAPFVVTRSIRICALVLGVLLAARAAVVWLGADFYQWRYFFTPAVLCFFFIGVMAHRLGALLPAELKARWSPAVAMLLAVAGLALGAYVDRPLDSPQFWALYVLFAASIPFLFALTRHSRIDRQLGELSYPVYLLHLPVGMAVVWFCGRFEALRGIDTVQLNIAIATATVLLSLAMLRVERPVEALRARLATRRRDSTAPAPRH